MIFAGDVAIYSDRSMSFVGFPSSLRSKKWIVNLEGAIVKKSYNNAVYNNIKGFEDYCQQLPIYVACMANNHITDTIPIRETKLELDKFGIKYLGAGSKDAASKELVLNDCVLLNFGWSVIQCKVALRNREGVNPLSKDYVLKEFLRVQQAYPDKKIIPIFHWNFELELYPMPRQRKLAKTLIDKGAELIIGHHSHLVQGIESYKGKFIVHGLGNWAFEQKKFHCGKVSFPSLSRKQCAFEYVFETGKANLYLFNYDIVSNKITFKKFVELNKGDSYNADFKNLNEKEYLAFFKKNRVKRKFLPIYKWSDSNVIIYLKNKVMLFRDLVISVLLR